MHKHFRIISIHNNMRSHGFATEEHTRIPGVWRKLHQLYDLRALDERENAYALHDLPDPLDPDDADNLPEFELPEEDFGELMWRRRYRSPGSDASSSPPYFPIEEDKALYQPGFGLLHDLPGGAKAQRPSSVPPATATPKPAKSTRASRAAAKSGKGTKATPAAKNAKAQSAVSESADEDEDEDDEEEGDDSAESEVETAPSTRRTKRSGARARPAPKRTRKR